MNTNILPVWDKVSGPKALLEIFDAGHTTFSQNCSFDPNLSECHDPYIDIDFAHAILTTLVTSHFKVFLDGDERYTPFLAPDYVGQFSDVSEWQEDLGLF